MHVVPFPPTRPCDGAHVTAALLAERSTMHAILVVVPRERVAGEMTEQYPVIIEEGVLFKPKELRSAYDES